MLVREAIQILEQLKQQVGDDAELLLFDRSCDREIKGDPELLYSFEILRGDAEVVIEFD